jgi:hypothetical protein
VDDFTVTGSTTGTISVGNPAASGAAGETTVSMAATSA